MKKYIYVTADTNDADYISEKNEITDEEIELIKPVIKAIKDYTEDSSIKHQIWNWWVIYGSRKENPTPQQLYVDTGKCSKEAFDRFSELVPYNEGGVHTIESVEIMVVLEEIKLL